MDVCWVPCGCNSKVCNTLFSWFIFLGCWWHGHPCYLTRGQEINERRQKPMKELYEETMATTQYLRDQGYTVVEIHECEWRRQKKNNPAIGQFLEDNIHRTLDQKRTLPKKDILAAIKNGTLFGVVECDIHVPEHLKDHFSEMCPIFKNTQISRDDIGEYMKGFAEEQNLMPGPRRSLIGSFFGERILLATPLLNWYLDHGLEVTEIYQVVEYTPDPCFQAFGEQVSNARCEGDAQARIQVFFWGCQLTKKVWTRGGCR